jgi:60 kDa SS-A/Ro ribonucleoprotein
MYYIGERPLTVENAQAVRACLAADGARVIHRVVEISVSRRATAALPFGGTDCALPMVEAMKHRWPVDAFVIYTDSETWAGDIHPVQALRDYRERMGIAARLIVVAMASNGSCIADPEDAGMLEVVGFDTATPGVISDFVGRG